MTLLQKVILSVIHDNIKINKQLNYGHSEEVMLGISNILVSKITCICYKHQNVQLCKQKEFNNVPLSRIY